MIPRIRRSLVLTLAAMALASAPAAAQDVIHIPAAPDTVNGCRGFGYGVRVNGLFGTLEHLPVVDSVYPGTPAARAGLQPGDSLVTINGRDMMGSVRGLWTQPPGTRYDIRVKRGDRTVDLVLIHGRARPDATGADRSRTCAPVAEAARAGAPPPSK